MSECARERESGRMQRGHGVAIDPSVVHSLNSSHPWDLHHAAVDKAEEAKHLKPDAICAEADRFVLVRQTPCAPIVVKVSVSWGSCSLDTQSGGPVAVKRPWPIPAGMLEESGGGLAQGNSPSAEQRI